QVGVAAEGDAEHVVDLAFQPIGPRPERRYRINREVAAGVELDFDAQVGAALQAAQEVYDFQGALAVAVLDGGDVHEIVVRLAGGVAQPAHYIGEAIGAHDHDGF